MYVTSCPSLSGGGLQKLKEQLPQTVLDTGSVTCLHHLEQHHCCCVCLSPPPGFLKSHWQLHTSQYSCKLNWGRNKLEIWFFWHSLCFPIDFILQPLRQKKKTHADKIQNRFKADPDLHYLQRKSIQAAWVNSVYMLDQHLSHDGNANFRCCKTTSKPLWF